MNTISSAARSSLSYTVRTLNQPLVKEGIKKVAGCATFAFGLLEIYDIYQILQGREISTESYPSYPKWVQVANKVVVVCAKISLILSAGVSRPGVFIISSVVGTVFSSHQLERVFGPNTIFAVNPWHPRHVISIAAVVLALPSVGQSTYKGICWTYNKIQNQQTSDNSPSFIWLTDARVKLMNLFNTVTSRPVLHMGNQLGRFVLRRV